MIAMRTVASWFQVRLAGLLLVSAVSCGLLNSDITKVTFNLPTKHYVLTAPVGLPPTKVTCGAGGEVATCPALPNVSISCDDSLCTAHLPVTVSQMMNLKMEVPALSSVNSQTLADITLESMSYSVANTTSIPMPALSLYLAPAGVTDPANAAAQKFGTVPAIPANSTASGDVVKEPGADALFIMYGQNFGTSFNFIASTTIVVPSGTPATGTVDITINGQVAAKLSL